MTSNSRHFIPIWFFVHILWVHWVEWKNPNDFDCNCQRNCLNLQNEDPFIPFEEPLSRKDSHGKKWCAASTQNACTEYLMRMQMFDVRNRLWHSFRNAFVVALHIINHHFSDSRTWISEEILDTNEVCHRIRSKCEHSKLWQNLSRRWLFSTQRKWSKSYRSHVYY